MKIKTILLTAAITGIAATGIFAQDGQNSEINVGRDPETGEPVIEFRRRTPTVMQDPEVEPAFAAPSATSESATPEPETETRNEFMPINEIQIIENPSETPNTVKNAGAAKTDQRHSIGWRVAAGNMLLNLGGGVKIGITPTERIETGVNLGLFGQGKDGYRMTAIEAIGFYEWMVWGSEDKVLSFYAGAGAAFGWYNASKRITIPANGEKPEQKNVLDDDPNVNVGLGGQLVLEVDFRFIDPDHSLYSTFKDVALSLDMRPMFYIPGIVDNFYPFVFTVGISFRYRF